MQSGIGKKEIRERDNRSDRGEKREMDATGRKFKKNVREGFSEGIADPSIVPFHWHVAI